MEERIGNRVEEDEECAKPASPSAIELRHMHLCITPSEVPSQIQFSAAELEDLWREEGFIETPKACCRSLRLCGIVVPHGAECRVMTAMGASVVAFFADLVFVILSLPLHEHAALVLTIVLANLVLALLVWRLLYANAARFAHGVALVAASSVLAIVILVLRGGTRRGSAPALGSLFAADFVGAVCSVAIGERINQLQPCNVAKPLYAKSSSSAAPNE
jgi:hypothetical protein